MKNNDIFSCKESARSNKILGVIDEDPFGSSTWSGSSKFFFEALSRKGNLLDAISVKPSFAQSTFLKLKNIRLSREAWRNNYYLSLDLYDAMSKAFFKRSRPYLEKYDILLQIGSWYDFSKYTNTLKVLYNDGNLITRQKSPFCMRYVNQNKVKRAISYEINTCKSIDSVFCFSEWLAQSFAVDYGVPRKKIHVVGAGINLPDPDPEYTKNTTAPNILFIGVDFKRKGGEHLLKAFNLARRSRKDIKLKIVTHLKYHCNNIPGVEFYGLIDKNTVYGLNQLTDLYQWANVFVMPSLYEPFGICFIEAMAHRVPCVGVKTCAMPEIIDDKITGFLCDNYDENILAQKILEILSSPNLINYFGNNGYKKYKNKFTWDCVANSIVNVIERM